MSVSIGEQSHPDGFIHGCNMSTHPTRILKTSQWGQQELKCECICGCPGTAKEIELCFPALPHPQKPLKGYEKSVSMDRPPEMMFSGSWMGLCSGFLGQI